VSRIAIHCERNNVSESGLALYARKGESVMTSKTVGLRIGLVCLLGGLVASKLVGESAPNPIQLVISAPKGPLDGSTVELTATLTNSSDHDVTIDQITGDTSVGYQTIVRYIGYSHFVQERDLKNQPSSNNGIPLFSMSAITLRPGDHLQETVQLGGTCDLTEPGTYVVQVLRVVPEATGSGVSRLISNKITIQIDPHSESKGAGSK